MPVLRSKINCYKCKRPVDRSQTLFLGTIGEERRYECFTCYKQKGKERVEDPMSEKINLYCERCNYKFKSRTSLCPYCSKSDKVVSGDVSIRDLI